MNRKEIMVYETDASRLVGKAEKVVFPETIEKLQNIVRISEDIVPRGAGTNFTGGCIPKNSVVVDLNKMNKVLYLDKIKRTVYVESGVFVKELNDKLGSQGFEFPIQPLNHGISTIGGMIATNCCAGSLKYGEMRDWIEEIDFVDGRGELVKIGRTDLMDVCSMEGITGIIAGAKLKIISKPKKSFSIFQTDDLDEILTLTRRLKLEKEIIYLDFFSKQTSKILKLPEKYHLIIEFDSDRGKIKGEEYEKIKDMRNNVYYSLFSEGYFNSEDPKFFYDRVKEFILYLESIKAPYFSNIGLGIVNVFFKDEEEEKRKEVKDMMKKMGAKLSKYGYGITRKDFIDSSGTRIIERVKLRHDPFNKLNKGKVIRVEGQAFESRLKKEEKPKILSSNGEKLTAAKIVEEVEEELKAPEEKMKDFVKRVEKEEEFLEEEKENDEIKGEIEDYEQTFDSELSEERVKRVEEIARNIPREIIHKPKITMTDNLEKPSVDLKFEENKGIELRGKLSKNEENLVRGVMGNMFSNKKEEKKK